MIKDLILAILLGALLGFGATGGYYAYKNSATGTQSPKIVAPTTIPTPIDKTSDNISASPSPATTATTVSSSQQLTIISPQNEALVTTPVITLKGTTVANSLVVIQTPTKTYNTQADASGNFSQSNISLDGGANLIQVSAFDANDTQSDVQILVTYSSVKI